MAANRSINRSLRRLAPAVLIVAAVACGHLRPGGGQPPALLIFRNESLDQANVYAVAPGLGSRRLGTVMAGRTDTLTVPADLASRANLNIVARLLTRSGAAQTGPVAIRPGEQYQVTLPLDARLLSFLPASP
jgi:hypothetical protein